MSLNDFEIEELQAEQRVVRLEYDETISQKTREYLENKVVEDCKLKIGRFNVLILENQFQKQQNQ